MIDYAARAPLEVWAVRFIRKRPTSLSVGDLCPSAERCPLAPCWPMLHHEPRQVWQRYEPDFNFGMLDGLVLVLMDAVRVCGGDPILAGK